MRTHVNHLSIVILIKKKTFKLSDKVLLKPFMTTCFLDSIAGLLSVNDSYMFVY